MYYNSRVIRREKKNNKKTAIRDATSLLYCYRVT